MRPTEETGRSRGSPRRGSGNPDIDGVGPQGAALILELQRLRQALDNENPHNRRNRHSPHQSGQRNRPQQLGRPKGGQKRRQKGRVGKAIDLWLKQFGIRAPAKVQPTIEVAAEPVVAPPRRRSPPIAPMEPVFMDLTKPVPEMPGPRDLHDQDMLEETSRSLPRPAIPQTTASRLVSQCRAGVMAGVEFMLDRGGAVPPNEGPDGNLLLRVRWGFEHELRVGLRILILAALLGGSWFIFMPLAGAVVVPGNLVVQSNVKTIQHPTGGVVAEIKVRDGSRVREGDLLVRLDATQARAGLQMVSKQLDEVRARIARLSAERDGLARMEFPAELASRAKEDIVKSLLASEESLFKARATARQSQKDLLQSRIAQLTEEISGMEAQQDSKGKQLELIAGEMTGVQDLYDKHLVPLARLTALQRESARIEGERGQLVSSIAETKSKIGEAQLQIVRIDQDFRTDVVKELGDAQGKEAELVERSVAARDLLDRIEIRAPTSGLVHQLAAHTIGGVVRPGDAIMEIVPDAEDLLVEARLQPKDIDQVRNGQQAFVRFTAFNQRTTPQLTGTVSYVSADTSHDQQTSAAYFTVRIVLPDQERRRLAGQQLVPGMPAEVFMQTGSRTMMSYLFKPIADQMRRAFVEQ